MNGLVVGAFEAREKLADGPFGEVWNAVHRESGAPVALKLMSRAVSALPAAQEALHDVGVVARVAYNNVGKVYDGGMHDGRLYIVRELIGAGESLAARLARNGRMSTTQLAGIAHQIANALLTVARSNVAHLDLKPTNIFLVPDDERSSKERVVVSDFGQGKLVLAGPELGGGIYTAPEVWARGQGEHAADIYSLGCLAFEMATGKPPFSGDAAAQRSKHLHADAPSARSVAPDFTIALDQLLGRMLAKVPGERPRSVRDVAILFDRYAGHSAPLDETQE